MNSVPSSGTASNTQINILLLENQKTQTNLELRQKESGMDYKELALKSFFKKFSLDEFSKDEILEKFEKWWMFYEPFRSIQIEFGRKPMDFMDFIQKMSNFPNKKENFS